MNVVDGLQTIRSRLVELDAHPETLQAVDVILKRASLPAAAPATANSLIQLLHMLMRTPAANNNIDVYNDFLRLEEQLEAAGAVLRAQKEAEAAKPVPKTKKFYKQQKARDKKAAN